MNQENGMPIRFQLRIGKEVVGYEKWFYSLDEDDGGCWLYSNDNKYWCSSYIEHDYKDQAIGATSSGDPPQGLYFGDLIEFWFKDLEKPTVGLLIWDEYGAMVKYKIHPDERTFSYARFYVVEYHAEMIRKKPLKKLGSRYEPKMKEILKKAGLEEPDGDLQKERENE